MPQQDLQSIVQRMVEAGESEDNIALVIQHYKTSAVEPKIPELNVERHPPIEEPERPSIKSTWQERLLSPRKSFMRDVESFIPSITPQMIGEKPGVLNPNPEENPLLLKSVLPDTEASSGEGRGLPRRILEGLRHQLYKNVLQPTASPLGVLGTVLGSGPAEHPTLGRTIGMEGFNMPFTPKRLALPEPRFRFEAGPTGIRDMTTVGEKVISKPTAGGVKSNIRIRANPNGTFTNIATGEILDKAGKPIIPENLFAKKLTELRVLNKGQAAIYARERAEKFAKARGVDITDEESSRKFMRQLSGEHTKIEIEPLQMDESKINNLYKTIGEHAKNNPNIDIPKAAQAVDAINRLKAGRVPVDSQINVLAEIFGEEVGTVLKGKQPVNKLSALREVYDLPRSLMTVDPPFITSAAFRQGLPLIGTKEWFSAFYKSTKAFGSKNALKSILNKIDSDPLFTKTINPTTGKYIPSYAEQSGLRIPRMDSKIGPREEMIRGALAERTPVYGKYVQGSNRGYTGFLADLRYSRFKMLYNLAKSQGLNPETNLVLGKEIAEAVNSLTGSGRLSVEIGSHQLNLEKNVKLLTDVLFAPRLYARNIRMLNPTTYAKASPFVRQEWIKGSLRSVVGWWSIAELAELAGAEVSKDPSNADFGKIKIGNTRVDPAGGLQQYLVLGYRETIGGGYTSSASGKFHKFGEGYKPETRWSTAVNFATNRLNPSIKLFVDLMAANEQRPVYLPDKFIEMLAPMISGDLMQVIEDDPSLAPVIIGFGGAGMGVQTYEGGPQGPKFIPEKYNIKIGGR